MTDPYKDFADRMTATPPDRSPRERSNTMPAAFAAPYGESSMTRIQQVATKLAAVSIEQWLNHPDKEELMQRIAEELSHLPEFSPSPFVKHWEAEPKSSIYSVPDQARRAKGY